MVKLFSKNSNQQSPSNNMASLSAGCQSNFNESVHLKFLCIVHLHIVMLGARFVAKMHHIRFPQALCAPAPSGSLQHSRLASLQRSPGPFAVIKGPIREGRGKRRVKQSKEREGKGGKGRLFLLGSLEPPVEEGRREEGEGQGEELWLGRPGTSFSTLSIAHSFALQIMRESLLKNPKCNKTHVGRGFATDWNDPLTPLGQLTALPDPLVCGYGFTTTPKNLTPAQSFGLRAHLAPAMLISF